MQTWRITGCSTGFGRELALAVPALGWHAAVAARNPLTSQTSRRLIQNDL